VHELVEATAAPQPLVSQHLRVLKGAGVVWSRRRGREIAYALTDDHIAHIVADAVSHAGERPGAKLPAATPPVAHAGQEPA
jgi:DNA-binding transcriptional ArsR family regulator